MTKSLPAAEKEFTRIMDERIETRAKETNRRMEEMLGQAKADAASAAEALAQDRGSSDNAGAGGPGQAGRYFSATPEHRQPTTDYDSFQVWVPKTMEIKGTCDYGSRFSAGVSSSFAETYLEKLQQKLPEDWRDRLVEISHIKPLLLLLQAYTCADRPPPEHDRKGLVGRAPELE